MGETIMVPLAGREIEFQPPTDAQFLVVHRILGRTKRAMDESTDERANSAVMTDIAKILDVLDSMVVDPKEREFLERKIIDRTLDFKELLDAFTEAGRERKEEQERAAPAKKVAKRAVRKRVSGAG